MKKIIVRPFEFLKNNWRFLLFLVVVLVLFKIVFGELCIFKISLGIPCPSCGMTRAYKNLLLLRFDKAFYYHPLFLLVPFVCINLLYSDFKYINRIYKSKVFWIILFIIVFGTYIFRFIYLYPKSPMNINHSSILFRIIKLIKKI